MINSGLIAVSGWENVGPRNATTLRTGGRLTVESAKKIDKLSINDVVKTGEKNFDAIPYVI